MEAYETREHRGYTIKVYYDEDAGNPRTENDNVGTMVCFHGRYTLGDEGHGYNEDDYPSWNDLRRQIVEDHDVAVILPLGLYDHSGITMFVGSTSPFDSAGWDSGQVGWIFCTAERVEAEWSGTYDDRTPLQRAEEYLRGEVEEYDHYLRGDCWGYVITGPGRFEDWGYIGDTDDVLAEAIGTVNCEADYAIRNSPCWATRMYAGAR